MSQHAAGSSKINLHLASPKTEANGKGGPVGLTKQQYLGHNYQRSILHQQHLELATLTVSCGATTITGNISTWDKPVHWLTTPSKSGDADNADQYTDQAELETSAAFNH